MPLPTTIAMTFIIVPVICLLPFPSIGSHAGSQAIRAQNKTMTAGEGSEVRAGIGGLRPYFQPTPARRVNESGFLSAMTHCTTLIHHFIQMGNDHLSADWCIAGPILLFKRYSHLLVPYIRTEH